MKTKNIKYSCTAFYSNGKIKSRFFVSDEAVSNWANRQYVIDNDVTVKQYDFETDKLIATWHA